MVLKSEDREVLGESTSFNDSFQNYVAALDTLTRNNAIMRQQVFEGSCEKANCLVLKTAFEAAVLEFQALREGAQPENESELIGTIEQIKSLEKNIAELRSQRNDLQELHQGLQSDLPKEEGLEEQCAQLKAEKGCIQEENKAIAAGCFQFLRQIYTLQPDPEEGKELEEEIVTLRAENGTLKKQFEELKSQLSENDAEQRCAQLKSEMHRIYWENDKTFESCLELRKSVLNQEMAQDNCKQLEEEMVTLRAENVTLKKQFEELKSQLSENDAEQRYAQLKSEIHNIRRENESIYESSQELRKRVIIQKMAQEECQALEEEIKQLRGHNRILQEELEKTKSELPQEDLEQHSAQLKSEMHRIYWENDKTYESCLELRKSVQNQEMAQNNCKQLEEEIKTLSGQNSDLQKEHEELTSKLPQNMQQRYNQLRSERDSQCEELKMSDTIHKLGEELRWKQKCKAIQLSKDALEDEKAYFTRYHSKLINNYEQFKAEDVKYKEKIKKIETMKIVNRNNLQEIGELQEELFELQSKSEMHKHIDEDEADCQALFKKLIKKKMKIEKELETLKEPEVEIQEVTSDISGLRKENCSLYEEIAVLKEEVEKKGLLKAHLKSLKDVKKSLIQRKCDLNKEISYLAGVGKLGLVKKYTAEIQKHDAEIKKLQHSNDELQTQFEDLYVEQHLEILLKNWNNSGIRLTEEMKKINDKTQSDIREQRKTVEQNAGHNSGC